MPWCRWFELRICVEVPEWRWADIDEGSDSRAVGAGDLQSIVLYTPVVRIVGEAWLLSFALWACPY